eukprot:6379212-Prymnesium_polylepis.1
MCTVGVLAAGLRRYTTVSGSQHSPQRTPLPHTTPEPRGLRTLCDPFQATRPGIKQNVADTLRHACAVAHDELSYSTRQAARLRVAAACCAGTRLWQPGTGHRAPGTAGPPTPRFFACF